MPSPDDTFYNLKRLHVVFAVAAVALLATTVWMVCADHWRGWKRYQRAFRNRIEPWTTEAALRQQRSDEFIRREEELLRALAAARETVPERALLDRFCEEIGRDAAQRGVTAPDLGALDDAYASLAAQPSEAARQRLAGELEVWVAGAALRQENAERELRFCRADFDEARTSYESDIGAGAPEAKLQRWRDKLAQIKGRIAAAEAQAECATAHREALSKIVAEIHRGEEAAQRALADHRAGWERLERALGQQRPSFARWLLSQPLIDAFGRPLAIEQTWLPELQINYNFRQVGRFDRCTTCHQGIAKAVAGSPSEPAYPREQIVKVPLATPAEAPQLEPGDARSAEALRAAYGFALAPRGILASAEPTVGLVVPRTPAARAGLVAGDVILSVNGIATADRADVERLLLREATWGKAPALELRRGLAGPFCSHPRLDLYVGPSSPHPSGHFGCTTCHDGQGSATEFKFASHSPNDLAQRARWRGEHGWFWNPDWDLPMRPRRFAQSNCLKCHHQVTDLEASARFPDSPAPKLLAGYHLVRQLGCFGCHEIKGLGPSGELIGPDMRLEPNYQEAALGLLTDPALSEEQRRLARQLVAAPENEAFREALVASLQSSGSGGRSEGGTQGTGGQATGGTQTSGRATRGTVARLRASSRMLVDVLTANPSPGTMRKVGPSLRDVAGRLDAATTAAWVSDPIGFRPNTRMPQFFAMHEHLDAPGSAAADRFEAVEIRAMTEYLLAASQPVAPLGVPPEVTEAPSAERGKQLFRVQGCLACHRHPDFPEGKSTQGPDLLRIGAKLRGPAGQKWLTSWIRDPARHSPRTIMPNALVAPLPLAGEQGPTEPVKGAAAQPAKPRISDPAADIAVYLMMSNGWEPKPLPPLVDADLDELALLYLGKLFPKGQAATYLAQGIPESMAAEAQADVAELVAPVTREKKVRFVGRRTIRKRGCYGCHDIPGFEDAQGIGPALSDWGRKQQSQLAFEQVHRFLAARPEQGDKEEGDKPNFGGVAPSTINGHSPKLDSSPLAAAKPGAEGDKSNFGEIVPSTIKGVAPKLDLSPPSYDPRLDLSPFSQADHAFYREAILSKRREGFIWQKLRAPRSFDFQKTANKGYNEQLLMGRFALSDAEREAIITFVLGLVAEPPKEPYVFRPDARAKAVIEGRQVLDKYGCGQCHTLEMERWTIDYDPERFPAPPAMPEYDFLKPQVASERLAASQAADRRGLSRAELVGMPQWNAEGKLDQTEDEDGNLQYAFNLWEPAVIAGKVWPVAGAGVLVSPEQIVKQRLPRGGDFARLLYPVALAEAKAAGATASVVEAWGWVPPPLAGEGRRVQPAWLYEYLLDPTVIRPAAVLRMPKYNLSPAEAGRLADYFPAMDGVEFPYSSDARARTARAGPDTPEQAQRLDRAMRLVIDRTTYCSKCHLVGDSGPGGETRTVLAPNLERVAARIRPEYLRRWLANPKSILPYTAMPVNFPPEGLMGQEIYKGPSVEQLDAVMDLLLDYDGYLKRRVSVRKLIESGGKK